MTKHYVVLEFEQLHDGNLDDMPWSMLLEDVVTVTNWRNITPEKIEEEAIDLAIGSVFSDIGIKTSREAYTELYSDVDDLSDDSLELSDLWLCEQYQYETREGALQLVDDFIGIFTYHTRQLLQMNQA